MGQDISSDLVENVETTPDLPYMEFDAALSDTEPEPKDSGEIVIDESSEDGATGSVETDGDPQVVDVDSEEGIHDMSVEELEVEDEIEEISECVRQENDSISVEHDITNSKDSKVTSVVIESSSMGEKE